MAIFPFPPHQLRAMRRQPMLMFVVGLAASTISSCQAPPPPSTGSVTIVVSAAADLHDAFTALGQQWQQKTGHQVTFNFGSTGQLAQQIERGAAIDLFAAANEKFIADLDQQGLIRSATKTRYGQGRLTMWTAATSPLTLTNLNQLTQPNVQRIAIANPDHAPYGVAAREALQAAGIWSAIQPKLVLAENVRQAQQYAAMGNVDVAIVALSLSVQQPGKWQLIAENLHQPLNQMLAVPQRATHPDQGQQFAEFVVSPPGRLIMQKYGFFLPGAAVPTVQEKGAVKSKTGG